MPLAARRLLGSVGTHGPTRSVLMLLAIFGTALSAQPRTYSPGAGAALPLVLQAPGAALENEYVRVTRDRAPCASAAASCGDRVIVALSAVEFQVGDARRKLARGDIAVFTAGQSYRQPMAGSYFEVTLKPNHPAVLSPAEFIPPDKNAVLYDGERLFIFEERLAVGDTRTRHSHSQRVVIQLNRTRLQQWPEGEPEIVRDIEPDRAAFNPPVIHTVKNVGELPLRGIVIELKAQRGTPRDRDSLQLPRVGSQRERGVKVAP